MRSNSHCQVIYTKYQIMTNSIQPHNSELEESQARERSLLIFRDIQKPISVEVEDLVCVSCEVMWKARSGINCWVCDEAGTAYRGIVTVFRNPMLG